DGLGGCSQITGCPKAGPLGGKRRQGTHDQRLGWDKPWGTRSLPQDSRNLKKRHAEIRFIDKINSLNLDQNQCYRIICYVTWSPCHNCAKELVDFISNRHHLSLQLFASRLYFHWVRCYQRGLQRLQAKRVSVAVMKGPEFKDCWEKFVDHQGRSFPSWEKLEQYSESISRRLSRILRFANQNNLEDSFRDLRLGSPSPSSSRSDSR
uniref:single-stranded DNA cytosine deaminase n=1 Tax=Sus scrofa TaxID=9823 RepID=A0A8D1QKF8_PIG